MSAMLSEVGGHVWIGMSGTVGADDSVTFTWVNGDSIDYTNWNEYEPGTVCMCVCEQQL